MIYLWYSLVNMDNNRITKCIFNWLMNFSIITAQVKSGLSYTIHIETGRFSRFKGKNESEGISIICNT